MGMLGYFVAHLHLMKDAGERRRRSLEGQRPSSQVIMKARRDKSVQVQQVQRTAHNVDGPSIARCVLALTQRTTLLTHVATSVRPIPACPFCKTGLTPNQLTLTRTPIFQT